MAKHVGWGYSEHQTQPVAFSPFPQCELLLPGQTEGLLSQLPTPLLRLLPPGAGSRGQPPAHTQRQPRLQDHPADSCRTMLRAACSPSPSASPLLF